jgi:hypothetical protein
VTYAGLDFSKEFGWQVFLHAGGENRMVHPDAAKWAFPHLAAEAERKNRNGDLPPFAELFGLA